MKRPVIENEIIKGIRHIEYENLDKIVIKVSYLVRLKDYIQKLENEIEKLEKELNVEKSENKRLTGKILELQNEKDIPNFDTYV